MNGAIIERVLVTGDRNWEDRETIRMALWLIRPAPEFSVTLIHGDARGADTIAGEEAAKLDYEVTAVPADWRRMGKGAGPIRNKKMLDMEPDVVLAFHDDLDSSKGTAHCVREARQRGLRVIVLSSSSDGSPETSIHAIPPGQSGS